MALPEGFDVDDPACPKCGGPMWDNRRKKFDGDYKASRSDFSCKDKDDCGHGIWIEGRKKEGWKGGRRAGGGSAPLPIETAKPKLTAVERKAARSATIDNYFGLMTLVAERMTGIAKRHEMPLDMANVHAATFSVFEIMRTSGYLPDVPKPVAARSAPPRSAPPPSPPPPPAPRRQVPPERELAGAGSMRREPREEPSPEPGLNEDSDLPF